jgi:hypothetical protein
VEIDVKAERSRDDRRVFVSAHGMIVDVCVVEDGITVQITKGNDVVAECGADAEVL